MKAQEKRAYEASRRAEGWVDANATLVPAEVAAQVTSLRQANAAIAGSASRQDHEMRITSGASVTVKQRRVQLRVQLVPLASAARMVVDLTPELKVVLRVPNTKTDDEKLLASADAMAQIGQQYKDVLVQHGLAADFGDQLAAATAALKQAIDERGQLRSRQAGAAAGVRTDLANSRRAVRVLDLALTRVLRDDPVHLAEWKSAKRVTVKGVRGAKVTPVAPVTSAAPVAPVTPMAPATPITTSTSSATPAA